MAMKDNSHLEVISVRFAKRIRYLLEKVAKARGSDVSTVIRQAVHQELARLSFLTDEEKKALGFG